jgi:SAM-dependent methyltransferase
VAVPLEPIAVATPNVDLDAVARHFSDVAQISVPMDLYLCRTCGHVQILDIIDPEIQYTHFKYTTSISLGLTEHFLKLAEQLINTTGAKPGSLIVEIGSNDGTLLRAFKERGLNVLGIDPAKDTAQRASAEGIPTLATFFTDKLAEEIVGQHGRAAIVIANNTFANIDDLADVARGIERLLAPDGVFVFETSYGADVVEKFLLDTVYHEHLSYFMVRSLVDFFRRHGMELYHVEHIWTKGGSLRGFVQRVGGSRLVGPAVTVMAARERAIGLDEMTPYRKFAAHVSGIRQRLADIVAEHRRPGRTIAGYGASVGTVTLVQQFGLGPVLDFIADDKPLTDAIRGQNYRIPVLPPSALAERQPSLVIVLAWRYAEPIRKNNISYLESGGQFVVPLPDLKFL